MKLIAEHEIGNVNLIREGIDEKTGEKTLFMEGIFAQAEKKNRNKRIYPKKVLEGAMEKYIEDYVKKSRALGELNHPKEVAPNPERACILIQDLKWKDNDVYGKAKVLSTPMGELVKTLIKDGVQLGVSTRGVGSLSEKNGQTLVESDYTISAIDVVSNPSGIDCWVNGVLENVEYYYDKGVLCECSAEEYLLHKKKGSIIQIEEDFNKFLANLVL
jgi:hypothetical protein